MLLDNYYKLAKQSLCSVNVGSLVPNLNYKIKDVNGGENLISYYDVEGKNPFTFAKGINYITTSMPTLSNTDNFMHIVFGNSNDMVSMEDYTIKGSAFTGINLIEKSTQVVENGVQYTFRFQNVGQKKEIGEICIYDNFSRSGGLSVALWREVFTDKIIVEKNGFILYQIITKVGV